MSSDRMAIGRKWREGKVRPIQGNSPHDRPVSRGSFLAKESLRRSLPRHLLPAPIEILRRLSMRFLEAWRNLSGPMGFSKSKPNPGTGPTASRRSAPGPGKRTRREEHAPSHRPQMSSGRLFLDRGARQQSPSPLHRQPQNNMHSAEPRAKGDISILPGRGHFYFALT